MRTTNEEFAEVHRLMVELWEKGFVIPIAIPILDWLTKEARQMDRIEALGISYLAGLVVLFIILSLVML